MAATQPSPYITPPTRLDAQFGFTVDTPIFDNLNKVLSAVENRLGPIEAKSAD